jgi:predicted nucleic acid-binding Zn ribbon protein
MPNVKAVDRRAPVEYFHCLICGDQIPADRVVRKSVTCTAEHAKVLNLERRRLRDLTRCRFCNRPNTPEERRQFAAWRKSLPKAGKKRGPKPKLEAA